MAKDPRVDAYIAKAPAFAKPILEHFRAIVHAACPDAEETIKWSSPSFQFKGPMCGMESFKEYCRISFWKGTLLDAEGLGLEAAGTAGMLPRVTSIKELPSKAVLTRLVKQAARLNVDGVKPAVKPRTPKAEIEVPDFFLAALRKNKKALAVFDAFPPSHRREYVEWLTGAKKEDTRQRRLETAIAQLAEGKPQNWKYMK
jgi:uncharacterized protein YdeI (YjbR/CyaY-like superfamily)